MPIYRNFVSFYTLIMKSKYRFRHPKGRVIQVSFAHLPGKWFSTGTHDMTHAVLWAENKMEQDLKRKSVKSKITLNEFASEFFTGKDPHGFRLRNEKRNRIYSYEYYFTHQARLINYILPKFGDYLMDAISDIMIEDWLLTLKSYNNGRDLADSSKNKVLDCFRIVFEEARRQGFIAENPANNVDLINARYKKREPFTDIELYKMFPTDEDQLLKIWGNRMWVSYFLVMRDTGFRPGEAAALTPNDISFEYQGVFTKKSINFRTRKMKNRIKTTNKGFDYKVGLLTKQTITQLKKHIEEAQIQNDDLLFRTDKGKAIIPDTANKHLKLSMKRIGLPLNGRTQYSFRHAFETSLAGEIDQKLLLELMAHTRYRSEYDHRTPQRILEQLQPVLDVIEKRTMMQ